MPGSAAERRDRGRRRARAWCTPAWRAPGGPRHGPAASRAAGGHRARPDVLAGRRPHAAGPGCGTAGRPGLRSRAVGPRRAARIGLDDGRLRDGRSSVEGLSAAALPGLPSPRLTLAGRPRGDKVPDVLIEALAPIDAPPPAYLVGDGPLRGPLTRLIRARGLEAVVHLPGWSYEPARYIAQATVHVVPHARSRGRKAPCWPRGSASRCPHCGRRPGAHPGRGPRRPGPARGPPRPRRAAVTRPGRRAPRPRPRPGLRPAVHPQRSGPRSVTAGVLRPGSAAKFVPGGQAGSGICGTALRASAAGDREGEAGRSGMGPAGVPGHDLAEVAGPAGDGAVADLAARDRKMGNGHGEAAGT